MIRYMRSAAAFREWLEAHHATADEVWVGFRKRSTGLPSLTWPEAVDEALCFGWIDGIRKSVDETRYTIRFTPRRKGSNWSAVNLRKMAALLAQGRVSPAGLRAYEARDPARDAQYSYETRRGLGPAEERVFKKDRKAWAYFQAQPPHYRRLSGSWVVSAKKEETRQRRLAVLVDCSLREEWIPGFIPRPGKGRAKPARKKKA